MLAGGERSLTRVAASHWLRGLGRLTLLALPALFLRAIPEGRLPPLLAFAVTKGAWLIGLGLPAAGMALALDSIQRRLPECWPWLEGALARVAPRRFHSIVGAAALVLFLAAIPGHRWSGATLTGDEPKYLRLTESLYRDLDVDVRNTSPDAAAWPLSRRNLAFFSRSCAAAVAGLFDAPSIPTTHRWNMRNWTIQTPDGGWYYVQSPGLPALLLPAVMVQRQLMPREAGPLLPLLTLGLLWSVAFTQTALLAAEMSGSRLAGLIAASAMAVSSPLLIGGHHFYPECAVAAFLPWAARRIVPAGASVSAASALGVALACGALSWLHPKFVPLGLVCLALLTLRLRNRRPMALGAILVALVPAAALLLFDHHVTGLLRPDAFYQRFGASRAYSGPGVVLSAVFAKGLVNGIASGRGGLLIMVPATCLALTSLPLLWRRDAATTGRLCLLIAVIWGVAAIHQGRAPLPPPARLVAPAAWLLAAPLAVGFVELRRRLAFRWTAVALLLITGIVSADMLLDWSRTADPYYDLPQRLNFSRDLPDGRRGEPTMPEEGDLARGLLVMSMMAFWTWRFNQRSLDPVASRATAWTSIRSLHVGWWGTLLVLGFGLHAAGP